MNTKKASLGTAILILLATLALVTWFSSSSTQADDRAYLPPSAPMVRPLAQSCLDAPDLQLGNYTFYPNPPIADQPLNVDVEILNAGIVTGTANTWAGLYLDSLSDPPTVVVPANTAGLDHTGVYVAHFTIPANRTTAGWHYLWFRADLYNNIDESLCSNGEANNLTDPAIAIFIPQNVTPTPTDTPVPTATPTPTATPFPKPQIYFFTANPLTVVRGQSTTLNWQVYGEAVMVYLDGQPVAMEQTVQVFPPTTHVYTLRAENPGGYVEKTVSITVIDPTSTPTPTATSCPLAVIHDFGATRTTINRGESTILYWDLSGATEAYLNGKGVEGVSQQEFTLYQTTVFVLVAHNQCGDVQKSLTITVRYATPTLTFTPTPTRTPTWTPTTTPLPTSTPTRLVLTPIPTNPPPQNTITPYPTPTMTSTEMGGESPLPSPTPTPTEVPTETPTWTPTPVPTSTFTPTPEASPTWTPIPTPTSSVGASPLVSPLPTQVAAIVETPTYASTPGETPLPASTPSPTPTPPTAGGTIRAYICPLSILLIFTIGIIILSIVLPRLREKRTAQPAYAPTFQGPVIVGNDSLIEETSLAAADHTSEDQVLDAEPEGPVFKVQTPPFRPSSSESKPAD